MENSSEKSFVYRQNRIIEIVFKILSSKTLNNFFGYNNWKCSSIIPNIPSTIPKHPKYKPENNILKCVVTCYQIKCYLRTSVYNRTFWKIQANLEPCIETETEKNVKKQ